MFVVIFAVRFISVCRLFVNIDFVVKRAGAELRGVVFDMMVTGGFLFVEECADFYTDDVHDFDGYVRGFVQCEFNFAQERKFDKINPAASGFRKLNKISKI